LSDDRRPPEHPAQILASSGRFGSTQQNRVLNAPLQTKPRKTAPNADVTIDVLVAYTNKAASYYGDIRNELIELAIEEANESFRISNLGNVKLRLAHAYQTDYVEAGDQFEDLWQLADKGDGRMEEVHALRDKYRADVVVLIVDDRHGCGLSTRVHADAEEAFAVVHHECAATTHSIAHEIGHLIGARHDLSIDKIMTPFPYGHGYVNGTKWRDIMSYRESCGGCRRVPIWSSPSVLFEGEPAGTPGEDNARVIAEEAPRVAAFR
jgi:peptidyl-Asp metalloendopeptidase